MQRLGTQRSLVVGTVVILVSALVATNANAQQQRGEEAQNQIEEDVTEAQENAEQVQTQQVQTQIETSLSDVFQRTQTRITLHNELVTKYLGVLQEEIQNQTDISPNQQATQVTNIANSITHMQELRDQLENAATDTQVQKLAQEMDAFWQVVQAEREPQIGLILASRFTNYLDRFEIIVTQVQEQLDILANQDIDVTQALDALTQVQNSVTTARTMVTEAENYFGQITNNTQTVGFYNSGMTTLKGTKTELRQARGMLREAIRLAQ